MTIILCVTRRMRMDRVSMLILKWRRDADRYAIASADDLYEPIHTGFCSTDICHIYVICDTHRLILRILSIVYTNITNLMRNEDRNYDRGKIFCLEECQHLLSTFFQFEIGLDFWLKIKFATRRFKICKFPN